MKVCVQGLWHLGSVTAACLAGAGIDVIGLEDDAPTIAGLKAGRPPLYEPGLEDLLRAGLDAGRLSFTGDPAAVAGVDVVWVAFDTPVDDEDRADVGFVTDRVRGLFAHLRDGAVVLISSQLPVGSTRALARAFEAVAAGRRVHFAYSPENLRLGKAIDVFRNPERIIVGCNDQTARTVLAPLLERFCPAIQWIGVESAEMTKHALNAFLATSVTFINEVATVCERVGADAAEVEAALRSEPRIGQKAYIRPGAAFAGGTLARDVAFLGGLAVLHGIALPMIAGIIPSNREHRGWPLRQLQARLAPLAGKRVSILGLAYKPGTDALRRSVSIELIWALLAAGAQVRAFDPAVKALPDELAAVTLASDAVDALDKAAAAVVMTEWPEFQSLSAEVVAQRMQHPLVLDQNRFLAKALEGRPGIHFITIGKPL